MCWNSFHRSRAHRRTVTQVAVSRISACSLLSAESAVRKVITGNRDGRSGAVSVTKVTQLSLRYTNWTVAVYDADKFSFTISPSRWPQSVRSWSVVARLLGWWLRIPLGACLLCYVLSRTVRRADPSSRGVRPSVCVSFSVIKFNNNPLHQQWIGIVGQRKKERNKEERKIPFVITF